MKHFTFLLAFLIASIGFSQDLLLGFESGESGGVNGPPFGTATAPVLEAGSGANTTQVLKITGDAAGEPWQGSNFNLSDNVDLTSTQTMQIDVLSSAPITFLVKVTGGLGGAPEAAAAVTHNGDGTWQTLNFTFNTVLDGKAPMANGVYSKFVIHTYWAAGVTDFVDVTKDARTFYVDNIKGPMAASAAPTVAAPTPPARPVADVVSIYSDAYASIPSINYDAGWCGAGAITPTTAGGDAVLAYNDKGCQGINFASSLQDLTGFTHLHVDFFIAAGTDLVGKVFNLKIVPTSGAESEFPIDINLLSPAPVPGQWYSYDVPITFSGPTADIKQFGVDSNLNNAVWYDNLYFHKATLLSTQDITKKTAVNVYPNPTSDVWNFKSLEAVESVQVYDVTGKQVINLSPNSKEFTINTNGLIKGIYIARLSSSKESRTVKLIKQ